MLTFDNTIVGQLVKTANRMMRGHIERDKRLGNMRSYNLLVAELTRQGYELLGSGHFAAVFTHPDIDGVIKLGFKKEDSGAAYAAFCRSHNGVKHLPEIYDIKRFNSFYAVLMPQYIPLETGYKYGSPLDENDLKNLLIAQQALMSDRMTNQLCNNEFKSIFKTARLIREHFIGVASFDLHSDNAMKRSDGTMIITDPVSFKASGYYTKTTSYIDDKVNSIMVIHDSIKLMNLGFKTPLHLLGCKKPKFLIDKQERMRFKRR